MTSGGQTEMEETCAHLIYMCVSPSGGICIRTLYSEELWYVHLWCSFRPLSGEHSRTKNSSGWPNLNLHCDKHAGWSALHPTQTGLPLELTLG